MSEPEPNEFSTEAFRRLAQSRMNREGVSTADSIAELMDFVVARFAIAVEKDLCDALGRQWTAFVGVGSLGNEVKERLNSAKRLLQSRDDFLVSKDLFSEYVATLNK